MKKNFVLFVILLVILVISTEIIPKTFGSHKEHHLLDRIRHHQLPADHLMFNHPDSNLYHQVNCDSLNNNCFFTERSSVLTASTSCSNCHDQPLELLKKQSNSSIKRSHWDVTLFHADKSIMTCTTCHSEQNMDQLSTLTGEALLFDNSFKLCAQCHSTQYTDWKGGAHGKELLGWQSPRVAKTCVSCHNPHNPGFPKRFPARLNTQTLQN